MSAKIADVDKPSAPAVHPLVRVHPETGRAGLYINEPPTLRRFDAMTEEESQPLIQFLIQHATRPEFTCRIRWEVGTLAVWDNRCLMHLAIDDYPDYRRVMHRVTIKGDEPFGQQPAKHTT